MPLGQGDHGRIRPAEPQVSVGADQVLDALPVGYAEIGHLQLAIDDGRVQAGFRLRAKLPVDQVGGRRGDQGTLVALQQLSAASWSLSARSAVATSGPVSTIST